MSRLNDLLRRYPPDIAFVGIGENGHLAFNDPPADFQTEDPYIVITLSEPCRQQQVGEGWFSSTREVPRQAISMSIQQIMHGRYIVCTVVGAHNADAVHNCLNGPATPDWPASILQRHPDCAIFLDAQAAAKLTGTAAGS